MHARKKISRKKKNAFSNYSAPQIKKKELDVFGETWEFEKIKRGMKSNMNNALIKYPVSHACCS